jgi:multicomponent Na+:H+ antiporter subunit B
MTSTTRIGMFGFAVVPLACVLVWGLRGLPEFGTFDGAYGQWLNHAAPRERQVQNVVAAVAYDYRGLDTLIEETLLFASVAGVSLLLRGQRDETENAPEEELPGREAPATSDAIRAAGLVFAGFTALYGLYMVLHAHLTPGGGFQGGVILAAALLLVYLGDGYETFRRVAPTPALDPAESLGAGAFALVGVLGLLAQTAYLTNVLPLGEFGQWTSGGTILPINLAIGLSVGAGLTLLLSDFLDQTLLLRRRRARPKRD